MEKVTFVGFRGGDRPWSSTECQAMLAKKRWGHWTNKSTWTLRTLHSSGC